MLMLAAALAVVAPTPDWMGTLYESRPETRLTSMVIPGTHDSGAYRIDTEGSCKVVPIAGASPVMTGLAKSNPCGVGKLSKAQSQSFTGQLNGGIRYLDMRLGVPADKAISPKRVPKKVTAASAAKAPIVLQHTFASVRFTTALDQIVQFAKTHPREQVILDFQHIDLTGRKKVDRYYTSVIDKVLRSYKVQGTTVCSRAWTASAFPDVTSTTIGQAWQADRNLIVLHAKGELPARDCFRPREKVLYSPWPNTEDPAVSDTSNLDYLTARASALSGASGCTVAGGNQCGLFVNQLQLSFAVGSQASCLGGSRTAVCSLADLAVLRNSTVVAQMAAWQAQGRPINIAIVDFYEVGDTAKGLIALNP